MFCRLFEFESSTDVHLLYDYETCSDDCPSCIGGICQLSEQLNRKLGHGKFGWRISTRIVFPEPVATNRGGVKFLSIIQLIHPTSSDVWLCKGLKNDGETDSYFVYFEGKKRESFHSIDTMNSVVNGKYYEGRDLKESDFGVNHV